MLWCRAWCRMYAAADKALSSSMTILWAGYRMQLLYFVCAWVIIFGYIHKIITTFISFCYLDLVTAVFQSLSIRHVCFLDFNSIRPRVESVFMPTDNPTWLAIGVILSAIVFSTRSTIHCTYNYWTMRQLEHISLCLMAWSSCYFIGNQTVGNWC